MKGVHVIIRPDSPRREREPFDWKMAFTMLAVVFVVWFAFNVVSTERWFQERETREQCEVILNEDLSELRAGLDALRARMMAKEVELEAERRRLRGNRDPAVIRASRRENDETASE